MSQPPPPPGNPPQYGQSDGAVPPPPSPPPGIAKGAPQAAPQGPPPPPPGAQPPTPPPPPGGYGYPIQPPAQSAPPTPPPPAGQNPYAAPVPPGQNPYASAPTQPAFPNQAAPNPAAPPQTPPPYAGGQPPQPGYGYPAGQTPPPAGYPQTPPPGGYGQTPPPGGYGYGQTPPPGYPQPYGQQPPAGGGRNNKLIAIVAAVVAAVLVIGGGVYFATKGGGSDPKPEPQANSGGKNGGPTGSSGPTHNTTFSLKWKVDADTVAQKDNLKDTLGAWFTDKYVVKNQIDKVVGYAKDTGAVVWTIPAPSSGDCSGAMDASKNLTAIQYGANCEKIMAIDLAAGKMLWTKALPSGGNDSPSYDYTNLAVSGDAVGAEWIGGSIAYRLSDGKVLWQAGEGTCRDGGYAGGKQFVAVVSCDGDDVNKVQVVDTAHNGTPKWSWTAPTGTRVTGIASTDPVVVILGTESELRTDVAVLNNGRLQSRISLGTDKYDVDADPNLPEFVQNIVVTSDTVYLSLRAGSDRKGGYQGAIAAFNVSDGKQKWLARTSDGHGIDVLDTLDGKILAYEPAQYDKEGKLVTLDPASGAISPYTTLSSDTNQLQDLAGAGAYFKWHDGRLYIVANKVYAGIGTQHYVIVFG